MTLTTTTRGKLATVVVATLIAALLAPAIAGAQRSEPTIDQYEPSVTQISSGTGSGTGGGDPGTPGDPSSTGLSSNVGPLPFTGFDVITMIAVALAVTGLGLALQRAVSRPPNDGAI